MNPRLAAALLLIPAVTVSSSCANTKASTGSAPSTTHDMAAMPGHDMSRMDSHTGAESAFLFPDGDDRG